MRSRRTEPTWRLAFSRPGFLTFKLPSDKYLDEQQLAERHWTFAHVHGFSVGKVIGSQLSQLAGQVWELDGIAAFAASNAFADVHVWQPTTFADADAEGNDAREALPLCDEIERAVRMSAPQSCGKMRRTPTNVRRASARGGLILDVAVLEPGQWWIGYHRRFPGRLDGRAVQFPLCGRPMRSRVPMQKSKKRFYGAGCPWRPETNPSKSGVHRAEPVRLSWIEACS